MNRIATVFDTVLAIVAGVLFGALFLITVLNIVLRNIGGIAWLWIPGMTKFLFIWTVFIGTSVLYQRNDHLVMDFFANKLQPARKRVLDIVTNTVFLILLVVLVVYGFIVVEIRMGIPFETWQFSTGYAYLAVPVSAILMLFFCINKIVELIKGEKSE
jgi:TRAP-type transport system small permease protein